MKKTIFSLTSLSLLSTLGLCAQDECDRCPPPPCDNCGDPCREQFFVERSQLFVTGEFLYWTVEEGVGEYAVKMNQSTSEWDTFTIGKYQTADFDFCPGYRVSLAWYNEPKYWEVSGQYTHLFDTGSDTATSPASPDQFLNPTWELDLEPPYTKATSSISLDYHLGDLLAARVFDPNPHLRMRLLGGLTTGYIKQEWKMRYTNEDGESEKVKADWRFWGGGIRLGVSVDWFWGYQFYLTARTSFATMIGTYQNTTKQITRSNTVVRNATYDDHRFTMHNQFILGPSWQKPFDCWSFELFAGYEFNIWFNMQEIINSQRSMVDEPKQTQHSRGLLGLHGLTLRLTIGF